MGLKDLLFKPIIIKPRPVTLRLPSAGEKVWYAPKRCGMLVTRLRTDGMVIFQGGPIVKNKRGRQTPRWTVQARATDGVWRPDLDMWIFGEGPTPRNVRGQVVYPDPVQITGKAQGSFANPGG